MSISVKNLTFSYYEEAKPVISGLSAVFQREEVTIISGASGCGKSTLLYLIAGLYPHNAGLLLDGSIAVEGVSFAGGGQAAPDAARRSGLVGMMFQNPDLQFCMDTVENELIFCLENVCAEPDEIPARIEDALAFCGLQGFEGRTLSSLSGGEKQMVALACLYAQRPAWLLLDEPFANVDPESARAIKERLMRLHKEQGTGIIAVEHRIDRFLGMADRILLVENGAAGEVLDGHEPDHERLLAAGVLPPGERYPKPDLPERKEGEVILTLSDLSVSHEGRRILSHVNAEFAKGSIYAILGASGSGKSSLFGALFGLYDYEGSALFCGRELKKHRKEIAGEIGFVTQSPQDQFIGGTVRDEVQAAFQKAADADARGEEILRNIQLWKYRDVSPYTLSQGQQRRLGVAALMAYPCSLLVCDEPTYAQDMANTSAIMESLCAQARILGVALIFSTHDREAAETYADEIWYLEKGGMHAIDQSLL